MFVPPQIPRPAVPTTPPDGLSSGILLRCMPQTSRRQSHPESGSLLRERDLPLGPFPERESGLPVLIHLPFKDVRCLVETSQFLGRCLPVSRTAKTDRRTTPGEPSQPRRSEQGHVAVPSQEHALSGVLAIELPVGSEHRPIGPD